MPWASEVSFRYGRVKNAACFSFERAIADDPMKVAIKMNKKFFVYFHAVPDTTMGLKVL